ncbi:MAG: hypothetical protein ACE5H4_05180 [Candidatus Thorarchaeota archaeon]
MKNPTMDPKYVYTARSLPFSPTAAAALSGLLPVASEDCGSTWMCVETDLVMQNELNPTSLIRLFRIYELVFLLSFLL